jgi:hypothetical protein
MTNIAVPLTSEEEAALIAQAKAEGVSVDSLLRRAVLQIISAKVDIRSQAPHSSAEEFERTFEEIADMIPDDVPPLSDEALSRESIYTREDEWNRNH